MANGHDDRIDALIKEVEQGLKQSEREQGLDGKLYNSFVTLALLCTGAATVLGALAPVYGIASWLSPTLSALATFFIAIEKSLEFGPRWRLHRSITAALKSVKYRLLSIRTLPEPDYTLEVTRIRDTWVNIPFLEPNIPGVPKSAEPDPHVKH